MSDKANNQVLDTYSHGWSLGDSNIIYKVIDKSYTFSGLPNMEPVEKESFKEFWVNFRSSIESGGGPVQGSSDFMKFKNIIRRKVEGDMVESGQWEVPGFADGVYMTMAQMGKVMWEVASMTIPIDENSQALDTYSVGWAKGDSSIIYEVVDDSYTFSGLPNMDPVDKSNFKMFWKTFRSNVEVGGGPKAASNEFMKFKNIIRRKVLDTLVESGQWSVPGYAEGLYMSMARNGKVMWEEATM